MARDFIGSATSYLIGSTSTANITGLEITISCWIKPDAGAAASAVVENTILASQLIDSMDCLWILLARHMPTQQPRLPLLK